MPVLIYLQALYGVFGEQIFLFLQFRSEMKRKLEISFRITLLILVPNTL